MTLPVYLHSAMQGAPTLTAANGSINDLLHAALVNGFNTQSVVSATASGGVVTFNFASAPGFSELDTVTVAGASNATVNGQWRVQSASGNQVLAAVPGVPDGAVGGTITLKFSPLGWTRPYSGTGVAAYQQGGSAAHKRFLRVYDNTVTTAGQWFARGYGNMTAISTGTDPFPDLTQIAGDGGGFSAPTWTGDRPWWIVGTPRAFYLYYGYSLSTPSPGDTFSFVYGELARIAKPGDTYAMYIASASGFPNNPTYLCRSYTGVANTAFQAQVVGPGGAFTSPGLTYPDPASGGLTLVEAPAIRETAGGNLALRGFLPGMLCPLQDVPALTTLTNVSGATGRVAIYGDAYAGAQGKIALLLDEDWGDV